MKLRDILGILRDSYCRTTGIEYMHIQDPEQRQLDPGARRAPHEKPPREEQLRILRKLNQAEAFETFLQTKFVGQKRFTLEGGETDDPAARRDLRGRGRPRPRRGHHRHGPPRPAQRAGQHRRQALLRRSSASSRATSTRARSRAPATSSTTSAPKASSPSGNGATIKVSVAANPSHLEAVDPVLEGIARAKQDLLNRGAEFPVLPLLVHGDAAFAGQGVVAETLNLSQLRGYRTGGTIHVVVNNQVGFTTSPSASRSSLYCTDVARMVQAPIFHVNGDDPEACIRVAQLAFEYRQAFNKDVVIDLVCYRRRGHNEGDDPSFTQPLMYDLIEQKRSVRKLYTEALIGRGDITVEEAEQALRDYQQQLERVFAEVTRSRRATPRTPSTSPCRSTRPRPRPPARADTAVSREVLKRIADAHVDRARGLHRAPEGAAAAAAPGRGDHRGPDRLGHRRDPGLRLAAHAGPPGAAGRSGLAARHVRPAVRDDHRPRRPPPSGRRCRTCRRTRRSSTSTTRCCRSTPRWASSTATRSPAPRRWCSGRRSSATSSTARRPIIDEFISSGEAKWGSSPASCCCCRTATRARARTTRRPASSASCTLAAEDAFTVAQPSTPASYFHLLRQHSLGSDAPAADRLHAEVDAAAQGRGVAARGLHVRHVPAGDRRRRGSTPAAVETLLLCSGKITWDLLAERKRREARPIAHGDRAGRAALPAAGRRAARPSWRSTRTSRGPLGAGRAGQHGPVAAHEAEPAPS